MSDDKATEAVSPDEPALVTARRDLWIMAEGGAVAAGVVESLNVQEMHVHTAGSWISAPSTTRAPARRSPRSVEERNELLSQRPDAWEYLLYAGTIWQGSQSLEAKWRDHDLGYVRPTGRHLDDREAVDFVGRTFEDLTTDVLNLPRMLTADVQTRAFGPPGLPGDVSLIEHIAVGFVGTYERMLDADAQLRGMGVSEVMASVMEAAAHLTDKPVRQIRDFIQQLVNEMDAIHDRLDRGEPVTISLVLVLTMDPHALKTYTHELARARKRLGLGH